MDCAMADYRHQVAIVVNAPADMVEQRLMDVESWAAFLCDVENIMKVAHERYDFQINSWGHRRVARVVVRRDAREHFFMWKVLKGSGYNGTVRLKAVDGRRTQVTVALATWPDGFAPAVAELMRKNNAAIDAARLKDVLAGSTVTDRSPAVD
jgi:uncharacterized membrane protein